MSKAYSRVGFIGLGKLGLPCAAAMQVKTGAKVFGYDINPDVEGYIKSGWVPYMEKDIDEYLKKAQLSFCRDVNDVVTNSEVIFLAIQTPHDASYEGTTAVPLETKDFDYGYLIEAIDSVVESLVSNPNKELDIVVISTVLPGTMRTHVLPRLAKFRERVNFFYNPYFIAMGTTIPDFLNPEFTLVGTESSKEASGRLIALYRQIHDADVRLMQLESAELTKVAYNTFIGFKIVFSNYVGEICDKTGGDADEVTSALAAATERLISPKYLSAGMADGGGCHPRDQIAMSHLAKRESLSADPSGWMAAARDAQTRRQAELVAERSNIHNLRPCILGKSYKKDVNLTVGSPSLLLSSFLTGMGVGHDSYDPYLDDRQDFPEDPRVFFVATNHSSFKDLVVPEGSVVIDPWGDAVNAELNEKSIFIRPGRTPSIETI